MEFASYLAGERWSDHPKCTHGTLAHLARMVNDLTSDAARARLTPLIPSVIGLTSEDPLLDILLAVKAASAALPIAAEERQRSLAVAMRGAIAALAEYDDEYAASVRARAKAALRAAPAADRWAERFIADVGLRRRPTMTAKQCRIIVTVAVHAVAQACVDDADERLVALLAAAVSDTARFVGTESAELRTPSAADARVAVTV